MEETVSTMTMDEWLEALASPVPAPGGGAAAALLVATGAALIEMASQMTLGREKYQAVEPLMRESAAAAAALRWSAADLADQDSAAFAGVSAAYALPRATDEEKAERNRRIQAALKQATAVPLRTTECGVGVLEQAAGIAAVVNRNLVSDIGAGVLAARAGTEAAALNVRTNLAALKDAAYVAEQAAVLAALLTRATAAADRAQAAVSRVLEGSARA
jgi:formiminotetrahydrofolate cyclodeaminase